MSAHPGHWLLLFLKASHRTHSTLLLQRFYFQEFQQMKRTQIQFGTRGHCFCLCALRVSFSCEVTWEADVGTQRPIRCQQPLLS